MTMPRRNFRRGILTLCRFVILEVRNPQKMDHNSLMHGAYISVV